MSETKTVEKKDEGPVLVKNPAGRYVFVKYDHADSMVKESEKVWHRAKAKGTPDEGCPAKAYVVKKGDKEYEKGAAEAKGKNYDTKKGEKK